MPPAEALGEGSEMPVDLEDLQKSLQMLINAVKTLLNFMEWHKMAADAVTLFEAACHLHMFHQRGSSAQKVLCCALVITACRALVSRDQISDLERALCQAVGSPRSEVVKETCKVVNSFQGRGPAVLRRLLQSRPALQDVFTPDNLLGNEAEA